MDTFVCVSAILVKRCQRVCNTVLMQWLLCFVYMSEALNCCFALPQPWIVHMVASNYLGSR